MNDMPRSLTLLSAASVTGAAVPCQFPGRYCFAVAGTFGGATVGLAMLGPDGATWIDIEGEAGPIAITAARALAVLLPPGSYKATVAGGTGVSVSASLARVTD